MISENLKIIREIHNEQADLTTSLDGNTLLTNFKDAPYIEETTKELLWRCGKLDRTYFGIGFFEEHDDWDDDETKDLLNYFIQAMLTSSLIYHTDNNQFPLDILVRQFGDILRTNTELDLSHEAIYEFLGGLLDCESLAAWLLVINTTNNI